MKNTVALMLVFLASLFALIQQKATAQETKKGEKEFKNTIHFNLTNPLIFGGKSLVLGYERVINKRQSFTVNIGSTSFPSLNILNIDSLQARTVSEEGGFNISADYRFYLSKENKYPAPRGVYIGPYYSYNSFGKKINWSLTGSSGAIELVESDLSLKVHTVGFELGYQFIFWNRVSLDMILLGPGIAGYNLNASLGSNLSQADKEKFFELINDALAEKFPGYGLVIGEGNFKTTGVEKTTSFGYRYMVQVGFRF